MDKKEVIKQLRKASIIILDARQNLGGPNLAVKTAQGSLMKSLNCLSNAMASLQPLVDVEEADKR